MRLATMTGEVYPVLCGSAFTTKRISKLVSVIFVQYLPMWSFMHHIITIDVIPNGILPF
ncbi:MAG: hypothetical protein ACTS4X_00985 [Candidatus Hodgkinia cicadicola]